MLAVAESNAAADNLAEALLSRARLTLATAEEGSFVWLQAAEQLAQAVGHNNTMGVCCFGEQGMDHKRRACHGNLMFGCLLFSNKPRETAAKEQSKQDGPVGLYRTP